MVTNFNYETRKNMNGIKKHMVPYDAAMLADFIAKNLLFADPVTEETSPFDFSEWFNIYPQSYEGSNVLKHYSCKK